MQYIYMNIPSHMRKKQKKKSQNNYKLTKLEIKAKNNIKQNIYSSKNKYAQKQKN